MSYIIINQLDGTALVDRNKTKDCWWSDNIDKQIIFSSYQAAENKLDSLKFNKENLAIVDLNSGEIISLKRPSDNDYEDIDTELETRLSSAREMYPNYNSLHEAYGIMKEEFDEFWDEVKKKESPERSERCKSEIIDILVTCYRTLDLLEENNQKF